MKKRSMSGIAVLLLLSALVSCGNDERVTETTAQQAVTTDAVTEAETEAPTSGIEAVDCGGAEFPVITRERGQGYVRVNDISAESESGDILNDEIFRRNLRISEKYNLVFNITESVNVWADTRKTVSAGDGAYNLMIEAPSNSISLAADGMLLPLNELPHVNLDAAWWNQTVMNDMSVYGNHYIGIGDMTVQAFLASGVIYYSKGMAANFDLEDPYTMVREGRWTFDNMITLCKTVSADLNGNGQWDEGDRYGVAYNNFAWQILFYGIGENFVGKDQDDGLFFNSGNHRIISYLQKMMPISQDPAISLYAENYSHLGGDYRVLTNQNAFREGRALFWMDALYLVTELRDMEMDFGILPVPKYDESQEHYNSFFHTGNSTSVSVPADIRDSDIVGRVLEDLMFESGFGVRDAFIETTLKGKYARDNESADMLDFIVSNIRTDYALLLNKSGLSLDNDMRNLLNKGSTDAASVLAKKETLYNKIIEKYLAAFRSE